MFTGIIEEKGRIQEINQHSAQAYSLVIKAKRIIEDINIGDSIAVSGVCLTVTHFETDTFSADVMPETIQATSLRQLETNSSVNLERALQAKDRFGGHFVAGHVDTTGEITKRSTEQNAIYLDIRFPEEWRKYFHLKGSVSIDGVSLTIFALTDETLTISLIPHSAKETTLGTKEIGDLVNVECDLLAKQVHELLKYENNKPTTKPLTTDTLLQNGFI